MAKMVTCPLAGCGQLYQDWNGTRTVKEIERSYKAHLTGKHCLKGEAFKKAYREAQREGYTVADLNSLFSTG